MRRRSAVILSSAVVALCPVLVTSAGPVVASIRAALAARAAAPSGTWGRAMEVPGLAALDTGRYASISSVSCASAGDCAAGGFYNSSSGNQGFVVGEKNGVWGRARRVPGLAALNARGDAGISSVSCGSAGNCWAGGSYAGRYGHTQAFIVGERNGVWGRVRRVPGLAALSTGRNDWISSVSCGSAGDCAAGGSYENSSGDVRVFVAGERNGVWGRALEVPGSGILNVGGDADILSVSCGSAGDCAAGGTYSDTDVHPLVPGIRASGFQVPGFQAFVVGERNGVWGKAREVPGSGILNTGDAAAVTSVSCGSAGDCVAGGSYSAHASADGRAVVVADNKAFVVGERDGVWGRIRLIPGLAALDVGGNDWISSVSCGSAGSCSAGGSFTDGSGNLQAFVAGERNGAWGRALEVPGSGVLNAGGDAEVLSVSCASAGNCAVGGYYADRPGHLQAFVAGERNGVWGRALEVPGSGVLNAGGDAQIVSVSCASAGHCGAGGDYYDGSSHEQAFVVSEG